MEPVLKTYSTPLAPPAVLSACPICGEGMSGKIYYPREMMFGSRKQYRYILCSQCGTLWCADPVDPKEAYPEGYYSFALDRETGGLKKSLHKILAKTRVLKPVSVLINRLRLMRAEPHLLPLFRQARVTRRSRILDVGCGAGALLIRLHDAGFASLAGIDPNISSDIDYPCGIKIRKQRIFDISENYDAIILNHVLEHVSNPIESLRHLRAHIDADGYIMASVPLIDCYAFRKYMADFASIDAPRHIFVPSLSAMYKLAADSGLRVEKVVYYSGRFQFAVSEAHAGDVATNELSALKEPDGGTKKGNIKEYASLDKFARHLNRTQDGDRAAFLMKRT